MKKNIELYIYIYVFEVYINRFKPRKILINLPYYQLEIKKWKNDVEKRI